MKNDIDEARIAVGALESYKELIRSLEPESEDRPLPVEMPFIDPATRLSLRNKHDS